MLSRTRSVALAALARGNQEGHRKDAPNGLCPRLAPGGLGENQRRKLMEQGEPPRNTLDVWLWNKAQNCGGPKRSWISRIGPVGSVALPLSTQWSTAPSDCRQQIEAAAAYGGFGRNKALPPRQLGLVLSQWPTTSAEQRRKFLFRLLHRRNTLIHWTRSVRMRYWTDRSGTEVAIADLT